MFNNLSFDFGFLRTIELNVSKPPVPVQFSSVETPPWLLHCDQELMLRVMRLLGQMDVITHWQIGEGWAQVSFKK